MFTTKTVRKSDVNTKEEGSSGILALRRVQGERKWLTSGEREVGYFMQLSAAVVFSGSGRRFGGERNQAARSSPPASLLGTQRQPDHAITCISGGNRRILTQIKTFRTRQIRPLIRYCERMMMVMVELGPLGFAISFTSPILG